MEYYSVIKRNKPLIPTTFKLQNIMNFKNMLNQRTQAKYKYCMISFIGNVQKKANP